MKSIQHELATPAFWRAGLGEVIGTFFLALAVFLGGGPYAVGLTLAIMVYAKVSGASLNPAVTVALVVARHLTVLRGVLYIVAETVGALMARLLAPYVSPLSLHVPTASWAGDLLGVGMLILAVLAVAGGYVPPAANGIVIGGGLLAGMLASNGNLNPAVALALGQATSAPWGLWAPIAGALLFTGLFRVLAPFQVAGRASQGTAAASNAADMAMPQPDCAA